MGNVIKTYVWLFFILVFAILAIGIITTNKTASDATSFKADVISELECSHFSDTVIQACKDAASSKGYGLTINKMTDDNGDTVMCEVIVSYNYKISFIGINSSQQTRGYAR